MVPQNFRALKKFPSLHHFPEDERRDEMVVLPVFLTATRRTRSIGDRETKP
jgi:hypothetical protein